MLKAKNKSCLCLRWS